MTGAPRQLDWRNIVFLALAHVAAALGVVWAVLHFNPWTLLLAATWMVLCNLSITAGYHRLFALLGAHAGCSIGTASPD